MAHLSNKGSVLLLVAGLIAIAAYLNFSVVGIPLSPRLSTVLAFAIGPVALMGLLSFFRDFERRHPSTALGIARAFTAIAFALLTLMLVVQQSVFHAYRLGRAGAETEEAREVLSLAFGLVNPVQLGIDVTFDIFYCLGIVSLSLAFWRLAGAYRWIGAYGIVSAGLLLMFNLWTFPIPPADAGLIDLGPWTIPFWIGLILNEQLRRRRTR